MKNNASSRIRFLSAAIIFFAAIIIFKLYFLQIVNGAAYAEKADHQYMSLSTDAFSRGTIYFPEKNGTLMGAATLKSGFTVAINPQLVKDPEGTYQKLNAIVPFDHDAFVARAKKASTYEEVLKQVDPDKGAQIDALKIPGVSIYRQKWRSYPAGTLAAQTLGFVGYDNNSVLRGRYGLENYYDDTLSRADDSLTVNFFAEIFSDLNKSVLQGKPSEGDLVTTIEPEVQRTLESELAAADAKWHSDQTAGIIINPMTGEIYAMATTPSFDPNSFNTVKDISVFSNPLVESVREMGSIIKPLTMAAGLDSGTVTASTTYDDTGFITLNGKKISNYDGKARGVIPMQEVLNQSLNVGAAYVALKMGNQKFSQYLYDYGLADETGIDLPNEAHGLMDNLKSTRDVEHATAAFGQGIALTPIATVRALSSLANGGYLITPHVVKRIDYRLGYSKSIDPGLGKQVLKNSTSEEITRMLVTVVDKALLNGKAKDDRYSVAAKTGTAQMANSKGGGYYSDRYLHSFFGYFPAYHPKFLIFLYTVYPKGAQYASETLTPSFLNLVNFLKNYYDVPPDR